MFSGCGSTVLTVRPSNLRLSMLMCDAPLFDPGASLVEPYADGGAAALRSSLDEGQCENA